MEIKSLKQLLVKNNIPLNIWGKDGYKSLADLQMEIQHGESLLRLINSQLIRITETVAIIIVHNDKILIETNAKINKIDKKRDYLNWSIAEKVKKNEPISETLIRAFKEELHILKISLNEIKKVKTEVESVESPLYPGLHMHNKIDYYIYNLPTKFYKPRFIETNKNKEYTFEFIPISTIRNWKLIELIKLNI